jgi:site-specific DNA recombinase
MTQGHRKAVIYARVSSTKQVKEGDGIASQITRCRVYAEQHGCNVVETFTDDMSGSVLSRPGMKAMIAFLKRQKADQVVVIIDDISRLARSLETHLALRVAIKNAGGLLESPSIEFGDSSDSILVENLLASVSQHQRQKNGEQTKNRMVARMMNGYWSFRAPVGLKYVRVNGHGKLLHRDEPIASVIQQAYEGFASGRFAGMAEIMRFLQSQPAWPAAMRKTLTIERVAELMSRPLYAGYIHAPEWGIVMQRGKHQAIISLATYQEVQDIIRGKSRVFTRKDVNEDFPLRGYVTCADCGTAYTACWSKGRSARHPYYLCQSKGCVSRGKSVRRDLLESQFDAMLRTLRPTPELFDLASEMFRDLWNARMDSEQSDAKHMRSEVIRIERQIEQLVDRIVASDVSSIATAFENRVRSLEIEKAALAEKIALCGRSAADFDTTYRTAMEFLENPYRLWVSNNLADKRTVLKLAFAEPIAYARNEGFRTAEAAIPFKIFNALEQLDSEESEMVPLTGLEPVTPALRMRCSTN